MTDDHGAWATGAYGAREIRTPNIDRLAATGARFTSLRRHAGLFAQPHDLDDRLPSRHSPRRRLAAARRFLRPQVPRLARGLLTWPEVLKASGYTTAMCGKWHMGHDDQAQRGFTEWATVPGGSGPYRNPTSSTTAAPAHPGIQGRALGDFALDFLAQQKNGQFRCCSCRSTHRTRPSISLPTPTTRPTSTPPFPISRTQPCTPRRTRSCDRCTATATPSWATPR